MAIQKRTTIRLNDEQVEAINELETKREQTASQMIREAITYWLRDQEDVEV